MLGILPEIRTEPENAVSGLLLFQCLSGTENGRASCPAGNTEYFGVSRGDERHQHGRGAHAGSRPRCKAINTAPLQAMTSITSPSPTMMRKLSSGIRRGGRSSLGTVTMPGSAAVRLPRSTRVPRYAIPSSKRLRYAATSGQASSRRRAASTCRCRSRYQAPWRRRRRPWSGRRRAACADSAPRAGCSAGWRPNPWAPCRCRPGRRRSAPASGDCWP